LTAREFLSVLGPAGHHIEVVDANPTCICRFSRWTKRVHKCPPPGTDPLGYLEAVNGLLVTGTFDVVLPTHEQAWLFAAGSARLDRSARVAVASVDAFMRVQSKIEFARRDAALLGERLSWHGGLTLDYLLQSTDHVYIECNPRTVEPGNAAASGVNLPEMQAELSVGEHLNEAPAGRTGVRTHSSLGILLGTAAYAGTRRAVLTEALRLALHRGPYEHSRECLTPVLRDIESAIPLAVVAARVLLSPGSAERVAGTAVGAYSVTPEAIRRVAAADPDTIWFP
jgi:hypothetical protein